MKKTRKNSSLLPPHYDPFGLDKPTLAPPEPQAPLLFVIEGNPIQCSAVAPPAARWVNRLIGCLILGYGVLWILSLVTQSPSGQSQPLQDPLHVIQKIGRIP